MYISVSVVKKFVCVFCLFFVSWDFFLRPKHLQFCSLWLCVVYTCMRNVSCVGVLFIFCVLGFFLVAKRLLFMLRSFL